MVAVSVLVPAPGALIDVDDSFTVAPWGAPSTLRLTAEPEALFVAVVTVTLPFEPAATSMYAAESVSVSGGALTTVKLSAADCEVAPLVPTMFIAYTPGAVLAEATKVRVVLPEAESVAGANVAVTPAGNPVTENRIEELNPLLVFTVKAAVVLPPGSTEADGETAAIWKFGAALPSCQ